MVVLKVDSWDKLYDIYFIFTFLEVTKPRKKRVKNMEYRLKKNYLRTHSNNKIDLSNNTVRKEWLGKNENIITEIELCH